MFHGFMRAAGFLLLMVVYVFILGSTLGFLWRIAKFGFLQFN